MNSEPISSLLANTPEKGLILDAGCGDCTYSKILANETRNIISLDINKPQNTQRNEFNFFLSSIEYLPFKNDAFDFIYCLSVIQLINGDKNVIKEFHRILKPGGSLFFTVPTQRSPFRIIRELEIFFGVYTYQQYMVKHHHYYSKKEILELIDIFSRIKSIKGYKYNFFPRLLNFILDVSKLKPILLKVLQNHFLKKKEDTKKDHIWLSSNLHSKKKSWLYNKILLNNWILSNFAYHYIVILEKE